MMNIYNLLLFILLVILVLGCFGCSNRNEINVSDELLTKDKLICYEPLCTDEYKFPLALPDSKCPNKVTENPEIIEIHNTGIKGPPPGEGKVRIAYYCASENKFYVLDQDSNKAPVPYFYGPFEGYPQ